jgi:hypothetical protein
VAVTDRDLAAIVSLFRPLSGACRVTPVPGGHIHESWRVDLGRESLLLQRINRRVFRDVAGLMANVVSLTEHLASRQRAAEIGVATPSLVRTAANESHLIDGRGGCWRMLTWIPGATIRTGSAAPDVAREAARAFGEFLRVLSSYQGSPLIETIPRFHDSAWRFEQLDRAAGADRMHRAASASAEVEAILRHRPLAAVLAAAVDSGTIPRRLVHNDAKIGNVVFDEAGRTARAVIDLDTVMPGASVHDFGDLVRSTVTGLAEDEPHIDRLDARPELFAAVASGFLAGAGDVLAPAERSHLVTGARLITLEQAARFLTDYLEGDRYYQIERPDHNLVRARVQLALYRSLTDRQPLFERLVADCPTP